MEGEPLSSKDAVLLSRAPGLVVDGLSLLGSALGARRVVLAVGPEISATAVRRAATSTRVEVLALHGGFVAGQESALVSQIDGGRGVPTDPIVPVFRRGVDGRPTLVLNAETLAQLALLARYGVDWFRRLGTPDDPGTFLATVTGSDPRTLTHPGVLEVARATPLSTVLAAAGTDPARVAGVLVGGYHGAWVPGTASGRAAHVPRPGAVRRHPGRRRDPRARPGRPARWRCPPPSPATSPGRARGSADRA